MVIVVGDIGMGRGWTWVLLAKLTQSRKFFRFFHTMAEGFVGTCVHVAVSSSLSSSSCVTKGGIWFRSALAIVAELVVVVAKFVGAPMEAEELDASTGRMDDVLSR